jgi:hypothetical protein
LKGILQDLTNATQNRQVHPKQGTLWETVTPRGSLESYDN